MYSVIHGNIINISNIFKRLKNKVSVHKLSVKIKLTIKWYQVDAVNQTKDEFCKIYMVNRDDVIDCIKKKRWRMDIADASKMSQDKIKKVLDWLKQNKRSVVGDNEIITNYKIPLTMDEIDKFK